MKNTIIISMMATSLFILGGCSQSSQTIDHSEMNMNHENKNQQDMGMNHGSSSKENLQSSSGKNELQLPKILEKDREDGNDIYYTITAQEGKTEFFNDYKTDTLGYNSSFLGPIIEMEKGKNVHITLENQLKDDTTFHWHGLKIPSTGDGGPHSVIMPGEKENISFKVEQDAATLWFHPHAMGKTAEQVFKGLSGLIYVKDEKEKKLSLPNQYGENDFPLIIQDKAFTEDKQFDYEGAYSSDGTTGDTLLVNGTVNAKLSIKNEKIRFRILNGSNARNFTLSLSNQQSFEQIASDGGLLNERVKLNELTLTPSERAEIVVDFSKVKSNEKISLITKEGTVVLPVNLNRIEEKKKNDIETKLNDISIHDEWKSQKVSKKIELFGMDKHVTINGKKFDRKRIDLTQKQNEMEIWEIYNKPDMMGGMIHPFHVHGAQFQIVSINGKTPPKNEQGFKDTVSLKPNDKVKIAIIFPHKGTYMYHCHILEHEENGMMGQIKIE